MSDNMLNILIFFVICFVYAYFYVKIQRKKIENIFDESDIEKKRENIFDELEIDENTDEIDILLYLFSKSNNATLLYIRLSNGVFCNKKKIGVIIKNEKFIVWKNLHEMGKTFTMSEIEKEINLRQRFEKLKSLDL